MACSKEVLRIVLWMSWVSQWLMSSIYVALTLTTFTQLYEASAVYLTQQGSNIYADKTWRAPMATCILSAMLVVGFDLMSCITLVKKSINRAGPGFGYGFLVAFCFCLSFFLLLCGLILDSFRPKIKSLTNYDWSVNGTQANGFVWQSYDSQTFVGAEVFALINFVTFLLFAVMLVVLQNGVSEQLGIDNTGGGKYASTQVAVPPELNSTYNGEAQYYEEQYGLTEEQQALRGGGDTHMANQYLGDNGNGAPAYYTASEYQDYGNPAPVAPSTAYYGHAAYSQPVYSQPTEYYDSSQDAQGGQATGSGLLGGMGIGTTPAGISPPPPYHSYQQQL